MEVLAEEVWPDNNTEHSLPERELEVTNGKQPTYYPQTTQSVALCNYYVFHGLNILLFYLCGQPPQQHGRRFPALRSSTALLILRSRVSSSLADSIQQSHSFLASEVISSHSRSTLGLEMRASSKSFGILCLTPPEIFIT